MQAAELWPQALAIQVQLGHWDRVADLAPRAGDYEQLWAQERLEHPGWPPGLRAGGRAGSGRAAGRQVQ